MLSQSVEQAFVERNYQLAAHTLSIQQNAKIVVAWMLFFLATSITFFVHVGNLTVPDAMLFTVYSVTTAGFGSIRIPHTTGFLVAVIVFIYLGLASVTILAATLYQWTAWKSSTAKKSRSASYQSIISRGKYIYRSSESGRAAITASYLLLLLFTGTIVMMFLEDWNLAEAFYFATYVMTTVGYGAPVAPKSLAGTIFCVFWVPFNVSFLSIYMGNLGRYYCMITGWNTNRIQRELHRRSMQLTAQEDALTRAVVNLTASTTKHEKFPKRLNKMSDVLQFVLTQMSVDDSLVDTSHYTFLSPKQKSFLQKWLLLPSQWGDSVFSANSSRKPSLPLLLLVQERVAFIIAKDIAGHVSPVGVKGETTVSVRLNTLDDVERKWLIPEGPIKQAFNIVAMEVLIVVGVHKLVMHGADAIFSLDPLEVVDIFTPLLAAMADAGTMEGWMARTEKLAEESFSRSSYV
jgi:hypothetical protein